jgi:tRNA threonylcarbamoyladenosine biosynthesis protein TsaE
MAHDITLKLADEAATLALGGVLARHLQPGLAIYLHGNLGAGKTTLVRGLLSHLGHVGKVKSPTYTLVEPYVISGLNLYHFDLYRFIDEEEWDSAGFRDYFNAQSVCLIEWPEKAGDLLPDADIDIHLSPKNEGREATLTANSNAGKACLAELMYA